MTTYLAGLAAAGAAGSPAAARAAARCAKVCGAAWAPVALTRNRHHSQPTNYYNTNEAWGSWALTLVTSCDFYLLDHQNMATVSMRIALVSALRSGSSFSRATARRHTWHSMAQWSVPRVDSARDASNSSASESRPDWEQCATEGNHNLKCIFFHQISRSQHMFHHVYRFARRMSSPMKNGKFNEKWKMSWIVMWLLRLWRFWPCAALAHRLRRLKQPPQSFIVSLHKRKNM